MSDTSLTRRGLLVTGAAASGALVLPDLLAPQAADAAAFPFKAYHGVTAATHQQMFNDLRPQGYRMISLSVYGSPALYAAVWVKRSGPSWAAGHGMTAAGYQAMFNKYIELGYFPVIVSATGTRSNPVFAAVFEKMGPSKRLARHGLTDGPSSSPNTLANANKWARSNDCILKSLAVYGTGVRDRTYAGIWLPNPRATKWQAHEMGDGSGYQNWFNGYTQVYMRPSIVDANDGHQYAALFTDDSVGSWVARHGMTSAQYQTEFVKQHDAGRMPISVQGSGTGAGIRYTAVFAKSDIPIGRQWTRIDSAGASYSGVHSVMQNFMLKHGTRAGVLAVRKDGELKLSSGYTWAEPGYTLTRPDSLLRLASVSKAFACAGIQALVTNMGFDVNTEVFPFLGINDVALPSQVKDPRIDNVTVQQLVNHTGGWVRSVSGLDPVFAGRQFALDLGLPSHVSKMDVARYMYGEPLQYDPGDSSTYTGSQRYSNFGYLLLGLVVERATGMKFVDYLKQAVLAPIDVADVFTGATLRSDKLGGEVSYDHPSVGLSAWTPSSKDYVPDAYGTFLIAEMDTGGGLVASAPAVSAFINQNAVWGMGGRNPGAARAGGMPGTSSLAVSRMDGIDWAYIFNARTGTTSAEWNDLFADLTNAISAAGF